jgi:uncharacterized protein YkwD
MAVVRVERIPPKGGRRLPSTMSIRVVLLAAVAACAVLLLSMLQPPVAAAASCPGATRSDLPLRTSERVVFCLVNRERTKRGLRRLGNDRRLVGVARRHSGDQVRYRFLGHQSPRRGSLLERMKKSGFGRGRGRWTFGEILGGGRGRNYASPRFIVRAWMRRPIHSRAILSRRFTKMGVGAVRGTPSGGKRLGGRNFVVTFGG